ncbi:hypothetical protein QR680_003591 [Steinernema hermaphroditum]|uniref:Uncharacterized protein n=1 Tax=Steinernema hermaphroditum TaxID=289476 RepID=A0AA39HKW9_9BILA|nr:hypothetical protein QR680_003591 [Steinernema hermaphroditum]
MSSTMDVTMQRVLIFYFCATVTHIGVLIFMREKHHALVQSDHNETALADTFISITSGHSHNFDTLLRDGLRRVITKDDRIKFAVALQTEFQDYRKEVTKLMSRFNPVISRTENMPISVSVSLFNRNIRLHKRNGVFLMIMDRQKQEERKNEQSPFPWSDFDTAKKKLDTSLAKIYKAFVSNLSHSRFNETANVIQADEEKLFKFVLLNRNIYLESILISYVMRNLTNVNVDSKMEDYNNALKANNISIRNSEFHCLEPYPNTTKTMSSNSELERQVRRLQSRLKVVEEERVELDRQVSDLNNAKLNAERRVRNMESSLRSAEDNLEIVSKEKAKLEKDLEDATRDSTEAAEYHRTVKVERDRLMERYHSLEESTVVTETRVKQLEEKLNVFVVSKDFYENAARREKDRRRKVENDLMEKEDELVRMRRNRRILEEELDDMKAEVSKYRRENESLARKLADLKQNHSRSVSRLGSFSNLSDSRLNITLTESRLNISGAGSSSEWSIHGRSEEEVRMSAMGDDGDEMEKENFSEPTSVN